MNYPAVKGNQELYTSLNHIATYLSEGEAWHRRAANECRKMFIRGLGRWHEAESKEDEKALICLSKLLQDNIKYSPVVDSTIVANAEKLVMASPADFKAHFNYWLERENKLIMALNAAINESRAINIELYEKLCGIQKEVQNEAMRIEMVYGRFDFAGWNGHDIGVCSKWLHEYFEKEYDGGCIDFNIG